MSGTRVYCTDSPSRPGTGGGIVVAHELKVVADLCDNVVKVDEDVIRRLGAKLPAGDHPFLRDWLTSDAIWASQTRMGVPDHAHFYGGCFTSTVRYLRAKGVPVTYTCAAHDRDLTVEEYRRLGHDYPYAHISDDDLFVRYAGGYQAADLVIVPSLRSFEIMEHLGCKNVVLIPHGCQYEPFEAVPKLPDQFRVGYLGQVAPDKGLVYLFRAMAACRDVELVLAGHDPRYDAMMAATNRVTRFRGLGYVADPIELFREISVYVQPSVTEAFGIPALEAMAQGRPVIVSDGAGVQDLVRDGYNGYVVAKRDTAALAERIQAFQRDPALVARMGGNARQTAHDHQWKFVEDEYRRVFAQVTR